MIMLIAHAVSEQYKEKYDFYENLKNFLNKFKLNLSFKQEKIMNFLEKTNSKKTFNIFIKSYKQYIKNNELNLQEIKILTDEEKKQLINIIKNIGNLDAKNEINQINIFLEEIDIKLKNAENDKKKLCPMILKLSLLFAIGIGIILI